MINKTKVSKEPERSLILRYVIFAAMMVPLFALGRVHFGLWPHVLIAAIGIAAGHWFSYTHLDQNNRLVRGFLFVIVHFVVCWLFIGLVSGFTVPQAQFAIFAQAVTSFDLRFRRSLMTTLGLSLAILYVAASFSRTYELGIYLILFIGLVLAVFYIAERETGLNEAKLRPMVPEPTGNIKVKNAASPMTLFSVSFGIIALFGVVLVFIFTPRFANNPIVPPFTLNLPLQGGITSEIVNPGVPLVQINGWSDEKGDYFFGFDSNLDLRYRGGLSDNVVMYVRSPSRSYWRSHSFDYYDGQSWSQSSKDVVTLKSRAGVWFRVSTPLGAPSGSGTVESQQEIVQSFIIVREQPNLIFAAYRPTDIYITAENISVDTGDGFRAPEPLKAGMTYSVVSRRPDFDPDLLRRASTRYPADIQQRYLQLPNNISGRVRNLAGRLTDPYDNTYDKAIALNNHLLSEYPYNFFPPPHKPGAEVVDTFLFEDREGFCEMYVSSFVVMARSLGIPARLVTGYGAGDYNPITNYYEVRYSHAHSWAEVYFPEYGWVPFDPTPGWIPEPYPTPVQNFLFGSPLTSLNISNLPLASMLPGGLTGIIALFIPFLIGSTLLVGLVLLIAFFVRRLTRKVSNAGDEEYTPLDDNPTRRLILGLFHRTVDLLFQRDILRRKPWETFSEYASRVREMPALARLSRAAEVAAYRPEAPDEDAVETARGAWREVQQRKI